MSGTGGVDFKPAFQAEYLDQEFTRTIMHIKEDVREVGPLGNKKIIARTLEPVKETYHGGYMIYFPQGHSVFVPADDLEQLQRIGVLETPALIDMNSGEVVPQTFNLSPKEIVERKQHNRSRPPSQGGLATLNGEGIE